MAVGRQDMLYKDYTSNPDPIPTSFFIPEIILSYATRLLGRAVFEPEKKDVGMGLLV